MSDKNNMGNVKIGADVLYEYVSDAVLATKGVSGFFTGGIGDTLSKNILGRENKYRGIKIDSNAEQHTIDVFVTIDFGERIPDVAWDIQKNVKQALEDVMDIDIAAININVQGVTPR